MNTQVHPLEHDTSEAARFAVQSHPSTRAEYRRLVEKLTGHLPTWAARKKPGRKPNAERSPLSVAIGGAAE